MTNGREHPVRLCIFSGLPGVGKTTLARALAARTGSVFLRIDTIEQAIHDLCGVRVQGEGYRLAYRVARDNLLAGMDVIADSCNPIGLTRREWMEVALDAGALGQNIQIICSDLEEHRARIAARKTDIPGLRLPAWEQVLAREYHPWEVPPTIIDTAHRSVESCLEELLGSLA